MVATPQILDPTTIAGISGFFTPLVVSLVTKKSASDGLRAMVNVTLSGIVTSAALFINPQDSPITASLVGNTFVFTFLASIGAYKGVWKPTGVAGTITEATKDVGLGKPNLELEDKGAEEDNIPGTVLPEDETYEAKHAYTEEESNDRPT